MTPQIIFLVLFFIGIGHEIKEQGKKETKNAFSNILAIFLVQLLYYWGGFWEEGKWPQLVMGCIIAISVVFSIIEHNTEKVKKGLSLLKIIGNCVMITILFFGHFFDPLIKYFQ